MKFLPILLASTLIATPAFAAKGGEGGNTNCNGVGNINSPCDPKDGSTGNANENTNENNNDNRNANDNRNTNSNDNRNNNNVSSESSSTSRSSADNRVDLSNDTNVRNNVDNRVNSDVRSNSRATGGRSDASARATGGNSSSQLINRNTSYDERETPVAPLLGASDSATLDGVVVPLPSVGISGFYTQGDSYGYRDDIGITLGFRTPIGGGAFRAAALRRDKFRVIQEAVVLRNQGVLTYEAHPEHYIALYGKAPSPTDRPAQ